MPSTYIILIIPEDYFGRLSRLLPVASVIGLVKFETKSGIGHLFIDGVMVLLLQDYFTLACPDQNRIPFSDASLEDLLT